MVNMKINGLELSVNLGWPQDERKGVQIVMLDVSIHFPDLPPACLTDELADTYCYATLIQTIKNGIASRDFRLLEHLGYEIHRIISETFPPDFTIRVCLTKKPAILNLTGGVTFCYEK